MGKFEDARWHEPLAFTVVGRREVDPETKKRATKLAEEMAEKLLKLRAAKKAENDKKTT